MQETRNTAGSRDYFRTDFWEQGAAPELKDLILEDISLPDVSGIKFEKPARVEAIPEFASPQDLALPLPLVDEIPEMKFGATANLESEFVPVRPATEIKEPRKVVLQPMRNRARQAPELQQIDSAAAVPPLRF